MKNRIRITIEIDTDKPRNDINLWACTAVKGLIDTNLGWVVYLATEDQNTRHREIIKDET